jgi:lysophospholipase L1-like esterase
MQRLTVLLAAMALVTVPAAVAEPSHAGWPNSIIALGDSGSTGFNSAAPQVDAKENSWSTGDSPLIQSHYLRILAANPKIKNHNFNVAKDGARMRDLAAQASVAARAKPDYVTIELGGNDFCRPGETSPAAFKAQLVAGLRELARGAPSARVLVVGIASFSAEFLAVIGSNDEARAAYSDGSACDPLFDTNGKPDPQRVAKVDAKVQSYNRQLASACALFVHCRYDHAAIDKLPIELADFSSDWGHQSVQGLAKQAKATWSATFDFTDGVAPVSKASRSGRTVKLTATDGAGVAGIEYRLAAKGPWTRYKAPVKVPKGKTFTWRAVDVNGNSEASRSLRL